MALSAKLQVRQTQSLVITPQLMQAIRLLQMSSLDLDRFVASEVEQNPLLDVEPGDAREEDGPAYETEAPVLGDIAEKAAEVDAEPADLHPEQVGADHGQPASFASPGRGGTDRDTAGWDFGAAAPESLAELLEGRIDLAFADAPADRLIAVTLLAGLDEAGYLTLGLDEAAMRLGAEIADVERVLLRCQELAPTGLFARTLAECLALQLAERNRLDPAMRTLLAHLGRLAAGDRAALRLICGVDRDDLDDMIAEIRALDPKPGLAFEHEPVRTLIPDVFVRASGQDSCGQDSWMVELNDAVLPRLIVDRVYCAEVSARCAGKDDKRYMADCLQKANWLEKSLDQRARTVVNVASEIIRRQQGFLAEGVGYLRPLNLRMVADALGVHESTVSRAAANKTMATPRGIFEFRYFFTGPIAANTGGEAHSAEAVKHRIRTLIGAESPDAVLSDDALVAQLSREGIEIARRTVAKYRELMRIGSSVERRRQRRLQQAS